MQQAQQQLQRGGFTQSRGAHQADDLPRACQKVSTGVNGLVPGIPGGDVFHFYGNAGFLGFGKNFEEVWGFRRLLPGQAGDFHNPPGTDAGADGAGNQIHHGAEGAPQGTRHAHQHGHGTVGDVPAPQAVNGEAVAGVADGLSHQGGGNAAPLLEFVPVQLDAHRLFLAVFIPLDKGFHQAKGLDGLHVLENLLIEGDVLAGELLVLLLIFPHLADIVPGDKQ